MSVFFFSSVLHLFRSLCVVSNAFRMKFYEFSVFWLVSVNAPVCRYGNTLYYLSNQALRTWMMVPWNSQIHTRIATSKIKNARNYFSTEICGAKRKKSVFGFPMKILLRQNVMIYNFRLCILYIT